MQIKKIMLISVMLGSSFSVSAAELRHQFINPNFGGSAFNGAPLLSTASAQNKHKDTDSGRSRFTESFKDRLDRAILSQLSRRLVDNSFGEDGEILEGVIETGINTISIEAVDTGTLVTIVNDETGEVTVIEVPSF